MTLFCQEKQQDPSNRCKLLASILKDTFSKCHIFPGKLPVSSSEAEESCIDNQEEDDEVFVSAIISRYMESKCKRKSTFRVDTFRWALSPASSRLSRCSSATSYDSFVSVKTHFSRSSSLNKIDFQNMRKRCVIIEGFQCEGWPFGLCRQALLLPPLPKSPLDSWSWKKSKIHN